VNARGGHDYGGQGRSPRRWVRWGEGVVATVGWATGDEMGRPVARPSPPPSNQARLRGRSPATPAPPRLTGPPHSVSPPIRPARAGPARSCELPPFLAPWALTGPQSSVHRGNKRCMAVSEPRGSSCALDSGHDSPSTPPRP